MDDEEQTRALDMVMDALVSQGLAIQDHDEPGETGDWAEGLANIICQGVARAMGRRDDLLRRAAEMIQHNGDPSMFYRPGGPRAAPHPQADGAIWEDDLRRMLSEP